MTDRVTGAAQRVGDQAVAAAHAIVEQAAAAAVAGAERARGVGASLAGSAKERAPQVGQVPQQVTQKVSEDVVPSLRDIALQAASAALDLWQSARERALDAVETAQHEIAPQAAHAVAAGSERAKGASAAIAEKAGAVGDRAREASGVVAEKAGEVGERAKDASRKAAEATVETGKDTGAMLFWAGAAAGIVFYALLSHERREQLTRTAQTVATQVRELIKDFQGYDEEF